MKFIKMDFPAILYFAESKRNSFYEDALPSEKFEATGFFQPPVFNQQVLGDEEDEENNNKFKEDNLNN